MDPLDDATSERTYLKAVREVVRNMTLSKARQLVLVQGPVVARCDALTALPVILATSRCAGHLWTHAQGGVLVLGADAPAVDGALLVEADRLRAANQAPSDAACYNVPASLTSVVAIVFHRSSFGEVLSWLDQRLRAPDNQPFSAVLAHLADKVRRPRYLACRTEFMLRPTLSLDHANTKKRQRL